MPLHRATPVLQSADVARSIAWYARVLGFKADPFPEKPPYFFAILTRDGEELMLQFACNPAAHENWSVYLRQEGGKLLELCEHARQQTPILRGPERMFYGQVEFEIADPDGHHLIVAEELPPSVNVPKARAE
jgi:catechol 2,3-dioxygenase-like lactoylglutathione lyase family enzyme